MEEQQQKTGTSYGSILKSTALFGTVQILKAVMTVVKNKFAAIFIGAEGVGILGLFNSSISLIQTGAGLGVSQSAVRDVSEATGSGDRGRMSRIINVTNRVILLTGLIGCVITLVLSRCLADWTFHDKAYTISYCFVAIVVGLNIISEGRLAILKGTRQLRLLAYASVIGAAVSLFTSIPLYYFFGKDGIVPELLVASILALFTTNYFVRKITYDKQIIPLKDVIREGAPMVKMGSALMLVTFLQTIVALVINAYIRARGGLVDVGYYAAGTSVLTGYFGLLTTALTTDYYPRIAAVNKDNKLLQNELNRQSIVSLILVAPILVVFMVFLPFFIRLLFSAEFLPATDYVRFAIYWTLITLCSNQIDLILVAKYEIKSFTIIAIIMRVAQLTLCLPLYTLWGLNGLGISYAVLGIMHLTIMSLVVYKKYHIHFDREFIQLACIILMVALGASVVNELHNTFLRFLFGALLSLITVFIAYLYSIKVLHINIFELLKNKLHFKTKK